MCQEWSSPRLWPSSCSESQLKSTLVGLPLISNSSSLSKWRSPARPSRKHQLLKQFDYLQPNPSPRGDTFLLGELGGGGGGYTKAIKRLPVVTVFFFAYREINHGKWLKGRHHFESVNLKILRSLNTPLLSRGKNACASSFPGPSAGLLSPW